jgi:hypothetical protein
MNVLPLKPLTSFVAICVCIAIPRTTFAQTTGSISGKVEDSSGSLVAGAKVQLKSDLTNQQRDFTTDANGDFLFLDLIPGSYGIQISHEGFKTFIQGKIVVASQERVDLHALQLELGSVSSSVEVTDNSARVETDSSNRDLTVSQTQVEDTPSRARNYLDIFRTLPGSQTTLTTDGRGFASDIGTGVNHGLNGGQSGQLLVTINGISNQDSSSPGIGGYSSPSTDAIAEVKVLIANYNAEYGKRGGGQVNVVIKSGTREFHGSAFGSLRNEDLNANDFFNNSTGLRRPLYRYEDVGGSFGGPVIMPKINFNRSRTKLFFFYSEDYLASKTPQATAKYTMPTVLERSGDFSQTVTATGKLIPILNPLNNKAPFSGNIIPPSQISPQGYSLLNLFPLPFTADPTGQRQYNTIYQNVLNTPKDDRILRVDFGLGAKTTAYVTFTQDLSYQEGYGALQGPQGAPWGQLPSTFNAKSWGLSGSVITAIRPTLTNELTLGFSRGSEFAKVLDATKYSNEHLSALRGPNGQSITLPAALAGTNPDGLDPRVSFAANSPQAAGQGVTNPPAFGWGNYWPFNGVDHLEDASDSVSWLRGAHLFKAGAFYERTYRPFPVEGPYFGQYYFGADSANQYDSGYPYSNALLGSIQAYQQDGKRQITQAYDTQIDWFIQDTWKVAPRLTLDIGIRFQLFGPADNRGNTLNVFTLSSYNANQVGQLLFPATVNGTKVALNPKTGATYGNGYINFFDPASYAATGNPYSGMTSYPGHFFNWPNVAKGPRFGFGWDVFGNGRTAVRGGIGITYDRSNTGNLLQTLQKAPPSYVSVTIPYTSFSNTFVGSSTAVNVLAGSPNQPNPSTVNWSFGVQQNIGRGFLLDVAYVGNVAHHLGMNGGNLTNINAVAPYTTWNPSTGVNPKLQDPTSTAGALYTTNLIRALASQYPGYGTIYTLTQVGESNYNSLQTQVNRRFGKNLSLGSNYTWSRTIVFSPVQFVNNYNLTKNVANRNHAVNVTIGYNLPNVSKSWNAISRGLLDDWNVSVVGAVFAGLPMTVSCTSVGVPANLGNYWTGTPDASGLPFRCQMNGPVWLPAGTAPSAVGSTAVPRLWYPFAASSFSLPGSTSLGIGNTPPTLTYGPGFENFDISMHKDFRMGAKEMRSLRFEIQAFNAFNHFNPANPNTALTYNFATGAQTNSNFGTITTAQVSNRRLSVSLRFRF